MRITCPICGERDRREFYYKGADVALSRPEGSEWSPAWDDYIHNRENPAGVTRDLWYHDMGCGAWVAVTRNTVTHEVIKSELVKGGSK